MEASSVSGREVWEKDLTTGTGERTHGIIHGLFQAALLLFSSSQQEMYLIACPCVRLPLPLTKVDWSQAGYRQSGQGRVGQALWTSLWKS